MNSHLSKEDKNNFIKEFGLKKIGTPKMVANKVFKVANMPFSSANGKVFKVSVGKI